MSTTQALTAISAASDGTVYGLYNGTVLQASPTQPWTSVGGQLLTNLSVGWNGAVWGVTSQNAVFSYSNGAWLPISCSYALKQVSVGEITMSTPGGVAVVIVWGLDASGNIYQYTTSGGTWTPMPYTLPNQALLASICATADGSVWGLDGNGIVYLYTATQGWSSIETQPPQQLLSLSASSGQWAWGITTSGFAYQYDGVGLAWIPVTPNPNAPPPPILASIYCGADTTVAAMDTQNNAYQFDTDTQDWTQFPSLQNGSFATLSVGSGQVIWALDHGGNVWQFTGNNWDWTVVTVTNDITLKQIAVGSASEIWCLDGSGYVYQAAVSPAGWTLTQDTEAPQLSSLAVGSDGSAAGIGIDASSLQQYVNGAWTSLPEITNPLTCISVGNAQNVCVLDNQSNVYQLVPDSGLWQPLAVPASGVISNLSSVSAGSDGSIWALNSGQQVCMYFGPQVGWYVTADTLARLAATSQSSIWGVDTNGNAAYLNFGATQSGVVSSRLGEGSMRRRSGPATWDSESILNEEESTHLWIVNRAMGLAQQAPNTGPDFDNLYPKQGVPTFKAGLVTGLWAADALAPYNNTWNGIPFFTSHFYNPSTGKNYVGQYSPTGLTQCRLFFWASLSCYNQGDLYCAGTYLGLALHYLTDATQPMHSSDFTWFSSMLPGYHTKFETFVMSVQANGSVPTSYTPSPFGTTPGNINPDDYYIAAAENSNSKYYFAVCPQPIVRLLDPFVFVNYVPVLWRRKVFKSIYPMLFDAINITSQFIVAWWACASSQIPVGYTLVNLASGMVATVSGSGTQAGLPLVLSPWNNTRVQSFTLSPQSPQGGNVFYIGCTFGGMVAGTESTTVNAGIVQYTEGNGPTAGCQTWFLYASPSGDGTQILQNTYSNCYLSSSPGNASGTPLVQCSQIASPAGYEWLITPPGSTVYIEFAGSNLFANIANSAPSTVVTLQSQQAGDAQQQFLWVPLTGDDAGYYMILNAVAGLCLCMVGGIGLLYLQQQPWNPTNDNAKWSRIPDPAGSGNFYIQNKAGLSVTSGSYSYLCVQPSSPAGTQIGYSTNAQTLWTLTGVPAGG